MKKEKGNNKKGKKNQQEHVADSIISKKLLSSTTAHLVFIVLLVIICYANTVGHDFVYDDRDEMLERTLVQSLKNAPKFFTAAPRSNYYRPLRTLAWAIDFSLWKRNPSGYHVSNLLFYIFCCWGAYLFSRRILRSSLAAFCCTLLFLAHPLHTESIAWISGRGDPLAAGFLFFALVCVFRWADTDDSQMTEKMRNILLFSGLFLFSASAPARPESNTP